MTKKSKLLTLIPLFILLTHAPLLAQEVSSEQKTSLFKWSLIIGGALIAVAASSGAFCQAKSISSACEGISRNPGGASHIRFILIFGLVLIETLVIYALLISIIILMVQWGNYV
ncbi:ATP synthase F0 subunit C [bacterium]|nr:ATP synthase F0 subunit C [bacterium]